MPSHEACVVSAGPSPIKPGGYAKAGQLAQLADPAPRRRSLYAVEESRRGPWGSGPKGPWGSGPQSVGPRPPDLEDLLRRGQDRLQQLLPGGHFSGMGIALVLIGALAIWGLSGFFRVQSEELGVVLRFGKHVRTVQPGLNYHLPYPIETVLLPKALRVSTISIGMTLIDDPARRGRTMRDVPEESLMLTGDENIVDVDFTVLWRIKPGRRRQFSLQHPEPRRHREGGGRKRDARGDRPLQDPADPHRRPHHHRSRRAGIDAEDARQLRLRASRSRRCRCRRSIRRRR